MRLFPRITYRLTLLLGFVAVGSATQAQSSAKPAQAKPVIDSTKVYTFAERMPMYLGSPGMKGLRADFLREFQAASTKAGCSPPAPIFVKFIVGPSGVIYNVASFNNSEKTPHPRLSQACENALVEAARKLPRFRPGLTNNRRVAVSYALELVSAR